MKGINRILITKIDHVVVINSSTYEEMKDEEIKVKLRAQGADEREPNEILAITLSDDEQHLALITGKNLIKNQ